MLITRRLICALAFVLWLCTLLFIGKSNFALTLTLSMVLGLIAMADVSVVGVFMRMSVNKRSEPIAWLTVAALMPRDGHVVGEDNDVSGVILEVTDLRLKQAEIAT